MPITPQCKVGQSQAAEQDSSQAAGTCEKGCARAPGKVIGIFGAINHGGKDLHFGCIKSRAGLERAYFAVIFLS